MPGAAHLIPLVDNHEVVNASALQGDTSTDTAESSADDHDFMVWSDTLDSR